MTEIGLGFIAKRLKEGGVPYCFGEWTKKVSYPYFVGEYTESEPMNGDGMSESTFILTGTARGAFSELEIMRKNRKITLTVTVTDISRMAEINAWLQGRGDLIFSTDLTKKYRAYVNQAITPTRVHKLCGSVPIVFTVEPFAYSVTNPFVSTPMGMDDGNLTGSMTIISNGTAESCPLLYFSVAGKLRVTVNGTDTPLIITTPGEYSDSEYSYDSSIEEGTAFYHYNYESRNFYIDTAALVAYDGNRNVLTSLTSGPFPTFKTGENVITFELVKETWEHDGKTYISHDMEFDRFEYRKNERWY